MTQVNEAGRKPWLRRRDRRARRGLPLLLLTALLLVGGGIAATVALPTPLAMRIIGSKTVHDAHVWRAEVIELLDGGAATFEAGRLSAREHERLSQITALSDIYRYKLFTNQGTIFWSTRPSDIGRSTVEDYFRTVVMQGGDYFGTGTAYAGASEAAAGHGGLRQIAEIYVPVFEGGVVVGAIEFYSDITELRQLIIGQIRLGLGVLTASGMAMLIALAALMQKSSRAEVALLRQRAADERALRDTQVTLSREVSLMAELSSWLQSCRSLDELYGMIARVMPLLLPGTRGSLYVYSNSRDVLDGVASWNGSQHHEHIRPDDCWALRRGHPYVYGANEISFRCDHDGGGDSREADEDSPAFCLPVLAHGETLGLLHAHPLAEATEAQFRETRQKAQLCAEHLSMALANVRMRDALHDRAIRDPLTGLYNRRHLGEVLRSQTERARRTGTALSLLSLDVDHFKRFNDTHGHDAGDIVLRHVGAAMEAATDGDEAACRPGGEEFVMVLPGASLEEAAARAETLRQEIGGLAVRYADRTLPRISVSIGVAALPEHGTTPSELLRAADVALYAAKRAGRDRVVCAGDDEVGAEEPQAGPALAALPAAE
ncbi:sensor domain-containing diguanylate cyclase [Pseudoroseicyclus aestuarii]|uniref:diguanylate cyclase n=1 Tax=Pseudoroseicyclus aestuarii TaxID=1795041 RepID=A0A318SST9_9RHOB|nr:diguanylate cyclase [Pseudoroseicyclus aestuarii]PYE82352.1 diguanylate cyclase (GGDEF)-like protein [Pseudoroseicyclus aestuarii]